jgi:hypothetical protein
LQAQYVDGDIREVVREQIVRAAAALNGEESQALSAEESAVRLRAYAELANAALTVAIAPGRSVEDATEEIAATMTRLLDIPGTPFRRYYGNIRSLYEALPVSARSHVLPLLLRMRAA